MTLLARRGCSRGRNSKALSRKYVQPSAGFARIKTHLGLGALLPSAGSKQICLRYVQDGGNKCTIQQTGSAFGGTSCNSYRKGRESREIDTISRQKQRKKKTGEPCTFRCVIPSKSSVIIFRAVNGLSTVAPTPTSTCRTVSNYHLIMGSGENGAGDIQSSAILFGLTLANANLERYANAFVGVDRRG